MTNPINNVPYLRSSRDFPEESSLMRTEMNKAYIEIANTVNNRTIGIFPVKHSAVTGESWFLTSQRQQTLRQAYSFGAIAPGAELDIPIGNFNFTQFTRIYGVATTNVPDYRPLPYIDPNNLNVGVALLVGPIGGVNQIRIHMGPAAVPITSGIVVLEWLSPV